MSSTEYLIEQIYNKETLRNEDSIIRLLRERRKNRESYKDSNSGLYEENYSASKSDYNEINSGKTLNYKSASAKRKKPKELDLKKHEKLKIQHPLNSYRKEERRLKLNRLSARNKIMTNHGMRRIMRVKRGRKNMAKERGIKQNKTFDRYQNKRLRVDLRRSTTSKRLKEKNSRIPKMSTMEVERLLRKFNPYPVPKTEPPFKTAPPYFFTRESRARLDFVCTSNDYRKRSTEANRSCSFTSKKCKIPLRKSLKKNYHIKDEFIRYHDKNGGVIGYDTTCFSQEQKRKVKNKQFLKVPEREKGTPYGRRDPVVTWLKGEVGKRVKLPFNLKLLRRKKKVGEKVKGNCSGLKPLTRQLRSRQSEAEC